jgi:hypothetical protein
MTMSICDTYFILARMQNATTRVENETAYPTLEMYFIIGKYFCKTVEI